MEQKAFELIQEKLQAALNEQGFGEAVPLETDNGRGVMFTTGEVAYGLFYETKQRRFVLRSATMKTPKEPGDWRQLSMWLFDEGENGRASKRQPEDAYIQIHSSDHLQVATGWYSEESTKNMNSMRGGGSEPLPRQYDLQRGEPRSRFGTS